MQLKIIEVKEEAINRVTSARQQAVPIVEGYGGAVVIELKVFALAVLDEMQLPDIFLDLVDQELVAVAKENYLRFLHALDRKAEVLDHREAALVEEEARWLAVRFIECRYQLRILLYLILKLFDFFNDGILLEDLRIS